MEDKHMAAFDFEKVKVKAVETASKVADRSVEFAKIAGEKAKLAGKITKLKAEIVMEKDTAKKSFAEIGRIYYEKHRDNPDADMAQGVTEITVALEVIAKKQEEVDALKKELADNFDDIIEDVEEKVQEIVEDAHAAAK